MAERLVKPTELAERAGVSRSTVWNWIEEGKLPPRRKITQRTVGWLESEIEEFFESLPKTDQPPQEA